MLCRAKCLWCRSVPAVIQQNNCGLDFLLKQKSNPDFTQLNEAERHGSYKKGSFNIAITYYFSWNTCVQDSSPCYEIMLLQTRSSHVFLYISAATNQLFCFCSRWRLVLWLTNMYSTWTNDEVNVKLARMMCKTVRFSSGSRLICLIFMVPYITVEQQWMNNGCTFHLPEK